MKTKIKDGFDFNQLDCQYILICNSYDGDRCKFSTPCALREEFRNTTERYVAKEGLAYQLKELK